MIKLMAVALLYNGLVEYQGQIINCSTLLNKYIHQGIPPRKEFPKLRLCCENALKIARSGVREPLLLSHLRVCRSLGVF